MGKAAARKRTTKFKGDPVLDQLNAVSAKNMLITHIISMGWRLAIMVLLPIFIGAQLDKRFDSAPSLTLAAFFIAVFGASLLIYKSYTEINTMQALEDIKKKRRSKKIKRTTNV